MDSVELLTPAEFARIFRVDAKTVSRWSASGKIKKGHWLKTPGGHRRILVSAVHEILIESGVDDEDERNRMIASAREKRR